MIAPLVADIEDLTLVLMFYLISYTRCEKVIKLSTSLAIFLLFHNEFDKFYNTGAQVLDSIYHIRLL